MSYTFKFKPGKQIFSEIMDNDPRLTELDVIKTLIREVWDHAVSEGAKPIHVRVGLNFATALMAELAVPNWEPVNMEEDSELCSLNPGPIIVKFAPDLEIGEVIVY